jgi:tetratricopeptide (TPR) repeat protein
MPDGRRASRQVRRAEARKKGPGRKSFRVDRLVAPLLVLAGLFAYGNSLEGVFVMDDTLGIIQNPTIRALWPPWAALSPPASSPVTGRPLVNLSLALNYGIGGLNPTSYHLFNLLFHILAALVLFGIVRRALTAPALGERWGERATGIATAVSLLWVVHPLTSETLDYTIQRTELLMGFFFLLIFYCAIRGFEHPEKWGWFAGAVASFLLGLGCKEVIVVAPLVLLVFDWLFWSKSIPDALRRHRALYLGFAAVLVLFVLVVGTRLRRAFIGLGHRMSPWDYALTQLGVIVHYLRLALWPHPLVADYGGWPVATSVKTVFLSLLVVAALVALTLRGVARRAPLAILGVWFFAILAPTSSIRPISSEIAAERRMYLPLVAVVALAVLGIHALVRYLDAPRGAASAVVGVLAVVLILVTVRRNQDYRTTLSFWTDVVAKRPDNPRAHMWLGNHFREAGRTADAVSHLSEAVRIQPENSNAHNGLGAALAKQGKEEEAIASYREAVRLDPSNALAHANLGSALGRKNDIDGAVEHFREAVRLNPGSASAHHNLAGALVLQGLTIEAIDHFETALRLQPDLASARRRLEDVRRSLNE